MSSASVNSFRSRTLRNGEASGRALVNEKPIVLTKGMKRRVSPTHICKDNRSDRPGGGAIQRVVRSLVQVSAKRVNLAARANPSRRVDRLRASVDRV
jgi:hypothetical protein